MVARTLSLFLLLALTAGTAPAQTGETTIKGEVVDLVSYMTNGMKADSPEGVEIATASAASGNPLGILEDGTGKLYVVTMKQANTGANATLLPWLGMKITAKGKVYTKGSTRVLVLTTVGKGLK